MSTISASSTTAPAVLPDAAGTSGTPGAPPDGLRADLQLIADWIAPGSRVLDLGCGDGVLLAYLQTHKRCHGYGVEIDDAAVLACLRRGVNVIQQNIEDGLDMFAQTHFDVVVSSMAIQATSKTEQVLSDMSRVGREGVVSFPNFGHWTHPLSLLRGHMPMSRTMPYQWYDTPNLHLATIPDFEAFLVQHDLVITGRAFLAEDRPVHWLPGLRARQAIYRFRRR